jgi:hypothetical protein
VDWRSSSKRVLIAAALGGAMIGCGRYAVRASEKAYLVDRVMVFCDDGQESAAEERVLESREGSTGGSGAGTGTRATTGGGG